MAVTACLYFTNCSGCHRSGFGFGRAGFYWLDGETKAHHFENCGKTGELGIALLGESAIQLRGIQFGFFSDSGNASEGLGHLAESDKKLALITVFEDGVEKFDSIGGI